MIVQEPYGENLIRTYSDEGFYIIQNETGIKYEDAVDVQPLRYTYTETDEKIEIEPIDPPEISDEPISNE